MSFTIEVNKKNAGKWLDNESYRKHARRRFFKKVGVDGDRALSKEASKVMYTGNLWRSVQHRPTEKQVLIQAGAKYAMQALETGTPPGKFPNVKALERWGIKKLGKAGLGYVIARKIAKSGSRKYRRKGPKQVTKVMTKIRRTIVPKYLKVLAKEYTI